MNPQQPFPPSLLYYPNYPTAMGHPVTASATPPLMTIPPIVTFPQQLAQHPPLTYTPSLPLQGHHPASGVPLYSFICNPMGGSPGLLPQHATATAHPPPPPQQDQFGPNQFQHFGIPSPAAAAAAFQQQQQQYLAQPVPMYSSHAHPGFPQVWFADPPVAQQPFPASSAASVMASTTSVSGSAGDEGSFTAQLAGEFTHGATVLNAAPLVTVPRSTQVIGGGGGVPPHSNSFYAPPISVSGSASPSQTLLPNVTVAEAAQQGPPPSRQPAAGPPPQPLRQANGVGLVPGKVHRGVVKRFNPSRGFGFIKSEEDVDVFFHQSAVNVGVERPPLTTGSRVTFEVEQDHDGVQAVNVRFASAPRVQRRPSA